VEQNAHPVRSIAITDRDYDDLEPLRDAIGDARVVMLGEQTHRDGATFRAKARLVAFLHREMGFDVLAWESGMYDVDRVWQQIRAGEDAVTASRRGVFGVWSLSEEVRPVFEYVASTARSSRPLEMAGFDAQLTTLRASDSLAQNVDRFAREIGSPVVNDPEWPMALVNLRALGTGSAWFTKPSPAKQESLLRLIRALRGHATANGGRRGLFWAQTLESMDVWFRVIWAEAPDTPFLPSSLIARETQMSRNLVWLANQHFRGRKIIVWAASAHIARNLDALRAPNGAPRGGGEFETMGTQVHRVLGDDMYALGFTAARGTWGTGASTNPLPPPQAGSLEALLDETGLAYAFVDFRDPGPGSEWLGDMLARPMGYGWVRGNWPRVLDGMFYTREMTPVVRSAP
jgi:erythromycin esterase